MKRKIWVVALGLISVIAIIALSGCAAGRGNVEFPSGFGLNLNNQQQGIWVNGQGEVSVTPDIATLSLGISAQAATVADAQSQAAKAMDAVMTALTSNGVAAKDIQTQQFSIQQLTKWDPKTNTNIVTGYQVTNMVTAKIRTLDKAGSIIDAVATAGGDLTRINSISFSVDDPTVYNNQAREKAIVMPKLRPSKWRH